MHWQLFLQSDVLLNTCVHRLRNSVIVPFGHVAQNVSRERFRLLEANAPMAERAASTREQRVSGRVVKIDIERIRKKEFHMTQRVARPGPLAEEELLQLFRVIPIHAAGIDGFRSAPGSAQDLNVVSLEE